MRMPAGPRAGTEDIACAGSARLKVWSETSASERGGLGGRILGFRLRQAVTNPDIEALGEAVEAAGRAGLSGEKLVVQAIEFLERLVGL